MITKTVLHIQLYTSLSKGSAQLASLVPILNNNSSNNNNNSNKDNNNKITIVIIIIIIIIIGRD